MKNFNLLKFHLKVAESGCESGKQALSVSMLESTLKINEIVP